MYALKTRVTTSKLAIFAVVHKIVNIAIGSDAGNIDDVDAGQCSLSESTTGIAKEKRRRMSIGPYT